MTSESPKTYVPFVFNRPTDHLNYRILTSNFLRSCHFVTMTSSKGVTARFFLQDIHCGFAEFILGGKKQFILNYRRTLFLTDTEFLFKLCGIKKYMKYERRSISVINFFCNVCCTSLEFCIFKHYFIIFIKNAVETKIIYIYILKLMFGEEAHIIHCA